MSMFYEHDALTCEPITERRTVMTTTLTRWNPETDFIRGRYDRLFPELGRPWNAAGFCVRLTRLVDLAETRPELFNETV